MTPYGGFAMPQTPGVGGAQGLGLPTDDSPALPDDWIPAADAAPATVAQTQNPFDPGRAAGQIGGSAWTPSAFADAFGSNGLGPPVLPPLSFPPGFGTGGILGSLGSDLGTGGLLGSLANLGSSDRALGCWISAR